MITAAEGSAILRCFSCRRSTR